jgi:aspartate/glutamate/glutamine transport system permease protein
VDFWIILQPEYLRFLGEGLIVTLEVALAAILCSFVLGALLGILRYTQLPLLSHLATLYIEGMRNIPLLLVIFFGYFGFKEWGIQIPITLSVILSMTIFTSALIAEIVRSGLRSVERGQIEAARAQGLTYVQTLRYIIMPQALKRIIPPLVSQFVSLIKDTSLGVAISLPELTHHAMIIYNQYMNVAIPMLLFVALIYFAINYTLSRISRRLEQKLAG